MGAEPHRRDLDGMPEGMPRYEPFGRTRRCAYGENASRRSRRCRWGKDPSTAWLLRVREAATALRTRIRARASAVPPVVRNSENAPTRRDWHGGLERRGARCSCAPWARSLVVVTSTACLRACPDTNLSDAQGDARSGENASRRSRRCRWVGVLRLRGRLAFAKQLLRSGYSVSLALLRSGASAHPANHPPSAWLR